ncbi:PHP domain protein [Methanosalsum zhilinae DSM 4017]|uniref:PHP domain protein n=1 Tax=Methanosalsum zhilinae (strain DSM 4017 / NBRC 107636 / OCM 62 / WeN5) TaxID=679901 RepID=F7XPF5_METZD|nr:TIGR00375 family protein [Methanosalsum zhilinae]AEH60284.1 PHP domain protein [Methanosalsum zhilinae DSM 4017]
MIINADLHIHSKYSMATSKSMDLNTIGTEASKKGIDVVGTGDCLHPMWLEEIKNASTDDSTIKIENTHFVLTTEVEDINRVHHLLILPSISKAEELAERIGKQGNLTSDGRPSVKMDGCEIAEIGKDVEALIGPSHAFTPWTAIYAAHDSLQNCYKDMTGYISFLELGLSADTDYADRIKELHELTFLTNSDAHSPWPNKLAREFTQFSVPEISFDGIKSAILRKNKYGPTLNVGFYPEEGKYNQTACTRCFQHFTLESAKENNWRCPEDRGQIKKGVYDRINELADFDAPMHPSHRPDYIHLIPLSEIIMMALGHSSIHTKGVQQAWNKLITDFGSEVAVLLDTDIERLKVVDEKIVNAISAFRDGKLIIHAGGGGKYGWIELPEKEKQVKAQNTESSNQSRLFDY